jgi:hypothetical protein
MFYLLSGTLIAKDERTRKMAEVQSSRYMEVKFVSIKIPRETNDLEA